MYDTLIPPFLRTNDLNRPSLCQANTIGDYTYATDGHSMLIIKKEKTVHYECHQHVPDLPNTVAFVQKQMKPEQTQIPIATIFSALSKVKMVDDWTDCEHCDGDGCSICYQTGRGTYQGKVYDDNTAIQYHDVLFAGTQMKRLADTAARAGVEVITLEGSSADSGNWFKLNDDVSVIVMPIRMAKLKVRLEDHLKAVSA